MAIFVIGYMACGKTTFGRALARELGMEFIDMDFRIEQRFHTTIMDIFRQKGEESFRRMETAMLHEIGEIENCVISCGGGTPCFNGNMDYMLSVGPVIWLKASPERIVERLQINRSRRPLMREVEESELLEKVRTGLAEREPWYKRANIHFNSDRLENRRQISNTIEEFIKAGFPIFVKGGSNNW